MLKFSSFALALILVPAARAQTPIFSSFERGSEGWMVKDLNCSNFNGVLGTYAVDWLPGGGDPAGHIGRVDPSGNCYFFDAPANFLGDRSAFILRELKFSLRTTVNDWVPGSVLALIGDNGKVLVHDFVQPEVSWKRIVVPLDASAFRLNSATGAVATPAQFAAVMADLEALRISAEYGDQAGEEFTALDRVAFGVLPCLADIDDSGTVDGADLAIVLGSWNGSGVADLNGDGTVDGVDIAIVLGNWGACPG